MPTSLQGIAEKAQSQKGYRFRNLYTTWRVSRETKSHWQ